ncbi:ABC transporter substrate-binding protein [Paenibacillus silvae]|uniref:ABC transporter substrate-binding protein n=1 Tax=Paenibacillus silvae TaxID=1325358 RepID=UPI0025A053C9|nr:ABC transporter substrate-binding protein [Paenibacillus silvae]
MKATIDTQEQLLVWHRAALSIMDIRYITIEAGDRHSPYLFPASAFLYVTHGSATITLDGTEHVSKPFYMLHGGKGTRLDITLTSDAFHFYLILYKAFLPNPADLRVLRHLDPHMPFRVQYGFIPLHPAILYKLAEQMLSEWHTTKRLEHLHVKTMFYQFTYELLRQMDQQKVHPTYPNLTSQLINYIQEYYAEPLTRETLAHTFHYSGAYLSKCFKRETGTSIIDYLISVRVTKAKKLLLQTSLSLQEIAASVGYPDVSYFIRIFKKHTGITPKQYKSETRSQKKSANDPIIKLGSSIAPRKHRRYIENSTENHYQNDERGDLRMFKRNKLPVGITLLLCLTLLVTACSKPASTTSASGSTTNTSVGTNTTSSTTTGSASEWITYNAINGEVKIPKNPQRVVMVAGAFTGHLLALGIKPVGAGDESFNSYTEGKLDDVVNIGNDVPYEKIMELQPDLIVVWNDAETIEKLSKIAPTVAVEYGVPFRKQLIEFGKMTGREEQAKAWIADWDAKIAKYKPLVRKAVGDRTVSIFDSGSAKEFYAYGSFGRGGDIIYGEFDLKAPPIIQKEAIDSGKGWAKLSLELLPQYAGDYIFISGWTGDESAAPIFEGTIWESLPAVRNQHVYREDSRGFVFSDPISLEVQLEFVVKSLTDME